MTQNFPDNTLYEMDNLIVLRGMNSETVDLIATDPPFNTKRSRSGTAGFYVDNWKYGDTNKLPDQWKWNEVHPKWLEEIEDNHKALHSVITAAEVVQGKDTAAFLCFMSVRLLEMHRILKSTGSIYLHCDPTASHYIKACMDAIFGKQNFQNEIVWNSSTGAKNNVKKRFGRGHDIILFYARPEAKFNVQYEPLSGEYLKSHYTYTDENGRRFQPGDLNAPGTGGHRYEFLGVTKNWRMTEEQAHQWLVEGRIVHQSITPGSRVKIPRYKRYAHESKGRPALDNWTDIGALNSQAKESTGSPDQKPLALYERIIKASSNENDIVLDPFCGCATTIIAANNLKRRWIGIDRRVDARYHIITRLMGLTRKDREYVEKYATDQEWLDKQMRPYEMHYQTEPPKRTDNGEQTTPELKQVYSAEPENLLSHKEMKEILINQFGVECWGCGFQPPDKDDRYLHLDHINPKSSGGSNDIDNRSILCQPCNSAKLNTMTLEGLRRENKREKRMKKDESQLIDLVSALTWTRNHMLEVRERNPKQYYLFRNKT